MEGDKDHTHTCLLCGAREELGEIGFDHYERLPSLLLDPIWKCKICDYTAEWGYNTWPLKECLSNLDILRLANGVV